MNEIQKLDVIIRMVDLNGKHDHSLLINLIVSY